MPKQLVNMAEAARRLQVPYTRMNEMVRDGRIEADYKDRDRVFFEEDRLVRLLPALHRFQSTSTRVEVEPLQPVVGAR